MPVPAMRPRHPRQLALFQPARSSGVWEATPPEHRQHVERLLAQLLREHAVRRLEREATREVCDE